MELSLSYSLYISYDPIMVQIFMTVLTYQFLNININRNNSVKGPITNWATGVQFLIATGFFYHYTEVGSGSNIIFCAKGTMALSGG
jgi:hypothetical protein